MSPPNTWLNGLPTMFGAANEFAIVKEIWVC